MFRVCVVRVFSLGRSIFGFLVQAMDLECHSCTYSGIGSTLTVVHDDGDLQAPFFHKPKRMTHIAVESNDMELSSGPWETHLVSYPTNCRVIVWVIAVRFQLVAEVADVCVRTVPRSYDPFTAITQAFRFHKPLKEIRTQRVMLA